MLVVFQVCAALDAAEHLWFYPTSVCKISSITSAMSADVRQNQVERNRREDKLGVERRPSLVAIRVSVRGGRNPVRAPPRSVPSPSAEAETHAERAARRTGGTDLALG